MNVPVVNPALAVTVITERVDAAVRALNQYVVKKCGYGSHVTASE
jgi:hypothetical protein